MSRTEKGVFRPLYLCTAAEAKWKSSDANDVLARTAWGSLYFFFSLAREPRAFGVQVGWTGLSTVHCPPSAVRPACVCNGRPVVGLARTGRRRQVKTGAAIPIKGLKLNAARSAVLPPNNHQVASVEALKSACPVAACF